jgi:hypothetical protein
MSTALQQYRNASVTPLPIVVANPPAKLADSLWSWSEGEADFGEFDYLELQPGAAASVIGLDRRALRKLEQRFDAKLTRKELADILGFAKLIDAVRLGGDRQTKELCLAYMEKAHGRAVRDYPFGHEDLLARFFVRLCVIARLGIIYPKEYDMPTVAIAVPNLIEGLKLQLVLSLQESRASAHCERCGGAYIRRTREQRFCSERCNSQERQARYRAKNLKGAKGHKSK